MSRVILPIFLLFLCWSVSAQESPDMRGLFAVPGGEGKISAALMSERFSHSGSQIPKVREALASVVRKREANTNVVVEVLRKGDVYAY